MATRASPACTARPQASGQEWWYGSEALRLATAAAMAAASASIPVGAYVTCAPGTAFDVLKAGVFGTVVKDDGSDTPYQVAGATRLRGPGRGGMRHGSESVGASLWEREPVQAQIATAAQIICDTRGRILRFYDVLACFRPGPLFCLKCYSNRSAILNIYVESHYLRAGRPKYFFYQSAAAKIFLSGVRVLDIFRGLETF